jgi:hypothetical protein
MLKVLISASFLAVWGQIILENCECSRQITADRVLEAQKVIQRLLVRGLCGGKSKIFVSELIWKRPTAPFSSLAYIVDGSASM